MTGTWTATGGIAANGRSRAGPRSFAQAISIVHFGKKFDEAARVSGSILHTARRAAPNATDLSGSQHGRSIMPEQRPHLLLLNLARLPMRSFTAMRSVSAQI